MAYVYNGSSDYIRLATALITAAPCTLSGWFYSLSSTAGQDIVAIVNSSSPTNYLRLLIDGATANDPLYALARSDSAGSNLSTTSPSGYSINAWMHGAAVFASTTSRTAYLSGIAATANTVSCTPSSLNRISIGRNERGTTPDNTFNGSLAEIGMWDVALTSSEVDSLAKGARPMRVRPQSLVYYCPLVRNAVELMLATGLTVSGAAVSTIGHPRTY